MGDYISRDAVLELSHFDDFDESVVDTDDIIAIPAADVISVVRCKDCFYCISYNGRWAMPKREDWLWCKRYEDVKPPDWYCADGMRLDAKDIIVPNKKDGGGDA